MQVIKQKGIFYPPRFTQAKKEIIITALGALDDFFGVNQSELDLGESSFSFYVAHEVCLNEAKLN